MKLNYLNLCFCFLIFFSFFSCVSAKQYEESQDENRMLRDQIGRESESARNEIERLFNEIEALKEDKIQLENQIIACKNDLDALQQDQMMLEGLNKNLQDQFRNVVAGSAVEKDELLSSLDKYKNTLQEKEKKLTALSNELEMRERDLNNLTKELSARDQKMKELEGLLAEKEGYIQKIRKNLDNLLNEFKDKGLSIELSGGRIYVRLAASLLFQSGKTEVDEAGKAAIISLARAIQNETDIQILVEGHTDNAPLKSNVIPRDNWELSVLRATAVVDLMLSNSKIQPKIITAAGKAEFMPVSTVNKNLNRRIEVIIIPNFDKIMEAVRL